MTSNLRCHTASRRPSQGQHLGDRPVGEAQAVGAADDLAADEARVLQDAQVPADGGLGDAEAAVVASPTVAGLPARRSTIPLRTGLARAPNASSSELFTMW